MNSSIIKHYIEFITITKKKEKIDNSIILSKILSFLPYKNISNIFVIFNMLLKSDENNNNLNICSHVYKYIIFNNKYKINNVDMVYIFKVKSFDEFQYIINKNLYQTNFINYNQLLKLACMFGNLTIFKYILAKKSKIIIDKNDTDTTDEDTTEECNEKYHFVVQKQEHISKNKKYTTILNINIENKFYLQKSYNSLFIKLSIENNKTDIALFLLEHSSIDDLAYYNDLYENEDEDTYNTVLVTAVIKRNIIVINYILSNFRDIYTHSFICRRELLIINAIKNYDIEMVQIYLKHNLQLSYYDFDREADTLYAIISNSINHLKKNTDKFNKMKKILYMVKEYLISQNKSKDLCHIYDNGDVYDSTSTYVEQGINLKDNKYRYFCLLSWSIYFNDNDLKEYLIKIGANIEIANILYQQYLDKDKENNKIEISSISTNNI
jgi:hypothetical protein